MLHFTLLTLSHTQLFDTLRSEQPAVFDKVVPVAGDIMDPDMGLSKEDTQLLVENVAVVFHLAATIRFDAPLRYIYISKLQSFPPIPPSLQSPPVPSNLQMFSSIFLPSSQRISANECAWSSKGHQTL